MIEDIPSWIKVKDFDKEDYLSTNKLLKIKKLNTVCVSANCPNRYECFAKNHATFMILGTVCTRNCLYCNVENGKPSIISELELKKDIENIVETIKILKLKYVVITSVTRDDLVDGGSKIFVSLVDSIRRNSNSNIELLIPDLNGNLENLRKITDSKPEVINHNIEVVKDLFKELRPQGNYETSINILKEIKQLNQKIKTKSGLMIGLGETKNQIIETLKDLRRSDCDILTIGQYLQPSSKHAKVKKYYTLDEFEELRKIAYELGFEAVESGSLIRSSYNAEEMFNKLGSKIKNE